MTPHTPPIGDAWTVAITRYAEHAIAQGDARTTVATRCQHLRHLARHCGLEDPWELTGSALLTWVAEQTWLPETRRCRYITLRRFYAWATHAGHIEKSPADILPKVRAAGPNPRPAPDKIYQSALAAATPRETLILRLAAEQGLRRGEIAVIHSRDLIADLDGWSLLVHGKGSKDRVVPLTRDIASMLRSRPEGYLLPGDVDGHLSPRWVGKLIARMLPEDWTLHKFRHRAATRMNEVAVGDLLALQAIFGWTDPKMAQRYVKVATPRLRRIIDEAA